jgi:hypothetical protein
MPSHQRSASIREPETASRRIGPGAAAGAFALASVVLLLPAPSVAAVDADTLRARLGAMRAQLEGKPAPSGYCAPVEGRGELRQAQFQNWPNTTWNNEQFQNWPNWPNY